MTNGTKMLTGTAAICLTIVRGRAAHKHEPAELPTRQGRRDTAAHFGGNTGKPNYADTRKSDPDEQRGPYGKTDDHAQASNYAPPNGDAATRDVGRGDICGRNPRVQRQLSG